VIDTTHNTNNAISKIEDLARMLRTTPGNLEWVLSRMRSFYRSKKRQKSNGSFRTLWIPSGALRDLQQSILREILSRVRPSVCSHGGIRGRSQLTNAAHHKGKPFLSTLDIREFFPSVKPQRVSLLFSDLGFSGDALSVLTKLTTWDFQLPQGAPTSPSIADLVLSKLDSRMLKLARLHKVTYTRYADDLATSGGGRVKSIRKLQEKILISEGFSIKQVQPDRKSIMSCETDRQELTGLVVNRKVNLAREKRSAIINEAKAVIRSGDAPTPSQVGKVGWLASVNSEAGANTVRRLKAKAKSV
jgi:RNA-directed DNA polymerase